MAENENNVLSAEAVGQLRGLFHVVKPDGTPPRVPQLSQPPREAPLRPPLLINTGSEAVPAWACCAVTDVQTINGEVRIKIAKPSTTFTPFYVFNGPNIIGASGGDDTKVGQLGEFEKVIYDSGTPTNGQGFGPVPGNWYVSINYPQVAICQGIYDSTNRIMLAKRLPILNGSGVAAEDIANHSSGDVTVTKGTLSSLATNSQTIESYNPGVDITDGDEVRWGYTDGQLECFKICTTGGSGGSGITSIGLTQPAAGITVSSSGANPLVANGAFTIALADDLAAVEGLSGTGFGVRTGASTWTPRVIAAPAAGFTISNHDGVSGNPTFALANDLAALEAASGTDTLYYRSGTDTWSAVTIGSNLAFSGGTLSATASGGSVTSVGLTQPAAGITVSVDTANPIISSGTFTLALANDLSALEGLSSTGFAVRTASDTWALRALTGTSNRVSVTNEVSGNPVFTVPDSAQLNVAKLVNLTSNGFVKTGSGDGTLSVDTTTYFATASAAALTKTDDTNVTLTLGGSPTTALLAAASITVGWAGQLSLARGGTGSSLSDPAANKILAWDDTDNTVGFWALGSGLSYDHSTHTLTATGVGTITSISIAAPAAGITQSGSPITTGSGTITLALANDLSALEGLSSTGFAVRTTTDTWALRALTGTTNRVSVTNEVSGNPVFNVPDSAQLNIAKIVNLTNNGFVKTSGSDGTLSIDTATYLTTAVTSIATSNGITGGTITTTGTISGVNAKADGSTKGVATFDSATFSDNGSGTISGKSQMSITSDASGFKLVGDSATPGNSKYYGTNGGGTEGFYDLPTVAGAPLTRTSDTNVTLTLGGSPNTALVNAASLTVGWTGTLGLVRGGTAADLSATGGTSQVLRQSSVGAAVTVGQLAASDLSNGVTGSGAVVLQTSPTIAISLTLSGTSPVVYLNDAAGTHTLGLSVTGTMTANHSLNFNFDNDATISWGGNFSTAAALSLPAIAAKGDLLVGSAANTLVTKTVGTNGQILTADSTAAGGVKWATGGGGTVSSVDLTMPGGFFVSGNPITSGAGTLAVTTALSGVLIGTGSAFSTATIGGNLDYTSSTLSLANVVVIGTSITTPNTGLKIRDTAASRTLTIKPGEAYSSSRTLTINVSNADRTLTIGGTAAAIDQDVRTTASPSFVGMAGSSTTGRVAASGYFSLGTASLALTGNTNDAVLTTGGSVVSMTATGDYHLTGLVGTFAQEIRSFINSTDSIGTPHTITIDHQNTSSSPSNRFFCPNSTDLVLNPGQSILFAFTGGGWHALSSFTTSAGTVTSVALTMPTGFSVAGSPVTGTGTLAVTTTLNGVLLGNGSAFSAVSIPSDATKFLNGSATPAFALVKDSDLSLSNITTNNVTTSRHGFAPILPNDASLFLNGIGGYTAPPGSGVTFANPSGLIGMTAVNGVAATAERSDSTHAIDPAIVPHWTGAHQFDSFRLTDVGTAHYGTVAIGSTYTVNRTLTLTTGDADRTVTLTGNPTLDNWFDQSVKTSASPTHVGATFTGLTASKVVFTDGSKALTSTGTVLEAQGGTGETTYTDGQLLIGDTSSGGLIKQTLTAGSNVTIVNAGGSITISSAGGGTGSAMVGPVSVVTSHGFSGVVANATTVPAITLSTTVSAPALAGDGTSISAASTTGSGSTVVLSAAPTISGGLTLSGSSPVLALADGAGTHHLNVSVGLTLSADRNLVFDFDSDITLQFGGDFTTGGALTLPTVAQGDTWYGSATGTISALAKNTSATRYLSNTGTSNNPAWAQVNLTNGVTGTLPVVSGGTGVSNAYLDGDLLIGNSVGNTLNRAQLIMGSGMAMTVGHGTITLTASGASGGTGTVTHVGIIPPAEGITVVSGSPVTGSGDITLALGNDLEGVEGLLTTGLACRVGTDSWNTATITGTSARITVNFGDGVSGDPNIDISTSYVGQATITTLGIVTTGTWSATNIALAKGGTGASLSDPGANRLWGWDDTDNAINFWTLGTGLSYDHASHTLSVTGGSGSVTSFSAGNLSPLFTTSVATATSTPALTFALSTAAANTYFGNVNGSTSAPSYTAAGALTKTDDTNVTLTLGGNPATSLLRDASLTLGWTGTLSLNRGGTASNLSATGGTGRVLRQSIVGAAITVSQLAASDLSNGTTGVGAVVLQTAPTISTSLVLSGSSPVLSMADGAGTHHLNMFVNLALSADRSLSFDFDNDVTLGLGGNFDTTGSLTLSAITAKGDLWVGNSSGAMTTKSVGSNGQVLTADSTATGGVKWATPSGSGSVNISTSNGITGGPITSTGTISGINAVADNSTKGVACFTSTDFNDNGSGLISLDYTNGQSSSASLKGYLTSTDWSTFNNKVPSTRTITTTGPLAGGGDLSADRTFSITGAAGKVLAGSPPAFTEAPTLGVVGSLLGSIAFAGNTSGIVVIHAQAAAGTPILTLGTVSGTIAANANAPLVINSTTGTISIAGTAGQILAGSSALFTHNPVLGVPGVTRGTFGFAGSSSGTVTVQAALAAGTWTLTLPTDDGTTGQVLTTDGSGVCSWSSAGSGTVTGTGTDNHIAVWNGTSVAAIKDSSIVVSSLKLVSNANNIAIDLNDGSLYDESNNKTINFNGEELVNTSHNVTLNWQNRTLNNASGTAKVTWGTASNSLELEAPIKFDASGSNVTFTTFNDGGSSNSVGSGAPTPTKYWAVKINGAQYKIPLQDD